MKPRLYLGLLGTALAIVLGSAGCSDSESEANPQILIEPLVSVGQVHAGMSAQEIIQRLGEPQRRTANSLEYTSLGFAVMPDHEGRVQVVMCGDVTGINGPLVKAFTGRTKEGIGLQSTREDLLKAYGEPSTAEKLRGGTESIRYDSLGITFTLEGGKVYHMIVRFPGEPPSRSIIIEPGEPAVSKP